MGTKKKALPNVQVGQRWIDTDRRQDGNRELEVLSRVKGSDKKDPVWFCQVFIGGKDTGRTTKVRQSRFKPGSTGYMLKTEERPEYGEKLPLPVKATLNETEYVTASGQRVVTEPVEVKVPVAALNPVEGFPAEPTADVVTDPSTVG